MPLDYHPVMFWELYEPCGMESPEQLKASDTGNELTLMYLYVSTNWLWNRTVSLKWTEPNCFMGIFQILLTVGQDSLFHGETLFVVSTSDTEKISFPFITQMVGIDFSAHTLFIEHTQFVVIDHFESLLSSRRGIRDVQLELDKKKIIKTLIKDVKRFMWHHFRFQ